MNVAGQSLEQTCSSCGVVNRIPRGRVQDDPRCGQCKKPLWSRSAVVATDRTFSSEVENSALPVLVDFWAPWCGPCRMVGPVVEEIARELVGRVKVVKINVDDNPQVAARFGIQSIPAMKVFLKGAAVDEWVGAFPKSQMLARLEPHLQRS